jgi:carnitine monooxygenase subunit
VVLSTESSQTQSSSSKPTFSPDPELSATLPASYYYDPQIFEREREQIWFKTWQYVGNLEDLTEAGSYVTHWILDQAVFVIRDKDGELRGFYNVCQHRGHILLEGKGRKPLITCPFHAWTYHFDGSLNRAPYSEGVRLFDPSQYHLTEIRVETLGFMVFVNLDPGAEPLSVIADGLLDRFRAAVPNFDDQRLVRKDDLPVKSNWKFILDGLERYHVPIIHPQTMVGKNAYITREGSEWTEKYHSGHIAKGNYDLLENHKDRLPYKMDELALKDIYVWYLWPNLVFAARQGPSNFQILQALPEGPESTLRVAHNFCLNVPPTEYDLGHMNTYRDVVWPQDREAMQQQQAGVKSKGYDRGRLFVDPERSWWSEHGTHHFDNLVWTALNGPNY